MHTHGSLDSIRLLIGSKVDRFAGNNNFKYPTLGAERTVQSGQKEENVKTIPRGFAMIDRCVTAHPFPLLFVFLTFW
jgi:hypothetical protein